MKLQPRFDKYILVEKIASGGMAEIHLAYKEGLDGFEKYLVIKKVLPNLASQKSFVSMFLNEAKLAAQLNHPNIVQIYELGKAKDVHFIAMEFVHGRDMRQVFPRTVARGIPFPMEYALKIVSDVCEGLHYAHTKTDSFGRPLNIVHRDITPENILVSFEGSVKITDFGIAKAATQIEHTKAGEIKGKLSYMSPEQCGGENLDPRSDIFTLGTILYEWLTGYKLFSGDNEAAIIRSILESKIYPPSFFKDDIPSDVEKIVMKCIEPDPSNRYSDAREVQYDIDSFLSSHSFNPSNFHLANFIKQLFEEDLKSDSLRFQLKREKLEKVLNEEESDILPELSETESSESIEIQLNLKNSLAIQKLSKRLGESEEEIVNRMVSNFIYFSK